VHSPEVSATLAGHFYDNIMITLATDLVEQFYTYWQICDNQAALTISFKQLFNPFLDKIISNG
jgi:hypothetical protein